MASHSITLSHRIAASPERVWYVLTDLPGAADTLSGVDRVEILSDGPYGVGTRWRETRTMLGKKATEEMWVSATDAPRSTVVEAESAGTRYTTTFTVLPDGPGTLLNMAFAGESISDSSLQRFLWKAFGRAGLQMAAKTMRTDLHDIGIAAESGM